MSAIPTKYIKLYKYTTVEACESIIFNKSIRFNNPSSFNDVFDCDLSGVYYDHTSTDKYCQADIELLMREFPTLKNRPELLNEGYRHSMEGKLKGTGFTCFTEEENNHLMWAHYANSHSGVCLEVSLTDNSFQDIRIDIMGEMNYGKFDRVNYCADKVAGLQRIFLTKSEDWKYEKEIRLGTMNGPGNYKFKPGFLKGVIFGARCSPIKIHWIKHICTISDLDLTFKKAEIVENKLTYLTI